MEDFLEYRHVFKVIGIGGSARRIIDKIVDNKIDVESLFIDTDQKDINLSNANQKLYIKINTDVNTLSKFDLSLLAWDYRNQIINFCENSDLVFIICNSSGKTASTISTVVGEILKEQKIITMGLCIKDFYSEDTEKLSNTKQCINELYHLTNSLVVISNERALNYFSVDAPNIRVISYVNNLVMDTILIINDICKKPGLVCLDYEDVLPILKKGGLTMVGVGEASGENAAIEAIKNAIISPLMEFSSRDINNAVVNISGTINLSLKDIADIIDEIRQMTTNEVEILFGTSFTSSENEDEKTIRVSIIATFDEEYVAENNLLEYIINNYTNKNLNTSKPLTNNNIFSSSKKDFDVSCIRYRTILHEKVIKNNYGMLNVLVYDNQYNDFVNDYIQNQSSHQILPIGEKENEVIKVTISSPKLNINEDAKELYWNHKCLDFSFYFFVPTRYDTNVIPFIITIYINNIIVSSLIYNVQLESDNIIENVRKDYNSAFISYSSKDVDKAALIVQGIKQARPDMQVFFDKTSLRTGDNWEKVIMNELDKKDVLFLLWSEHAKNSEWVDKEWRYVYNTKGEEYIDPIPLEANCDSFLPKELKHKHCNDMLTLLYSNKKE